MGYDASCTICVDGKTAEGTAWLEHQDLVFRGSFKLAIPLKTITSATAKNGRLHVRFGGRSAELEIGSAAAKWADRILNPPSRLDKLGVKSGMQVLLLGLDDERFERELDGRGADVTRSVSTAAAGRADLIFYSAGRRAALSRLKSIAGRMRSDAALWVVRPKGQASITEAETMEAGKRAGLVDVKVVSFSDGLTAEKFVIPVAKRGSLRRASSPSPRTRRSASSRGRS